ncbi:hypothetical protein RvY_11075 [Ramazzottius varieornatus]|uniref:Coiled-coil domain-containing protein 85C n=1 Tax=Ramazzottius varieornatus TaxID=947166 RepID=A0A1D1VGY8_RAMVA|nr:hypothetical protein RvY_11075 [Ramazzottius varieornatus]
MDNSRHEGMKMSSPQQASTSSFDHPNNLPPNTAAPPLLTDDQLARLSNHEVISLLRAREGECVRLLKDRAQLMKDVNRTLQLHLAEVRGLREVNQALQKDNQELRDLSCFLDDDRLKARKIAKEWQKFGKYTSTVMRQEVTAYQMKLYELEQKQEALLRENMELKELCLYLDDSRGEPRTCHVQPLPPSQSQSRPQSREKPARGDPPPQTEQRRPPVPPPYAAVVAGDGNTFSSSNKQPFTRGPPDRPRNTHIAQARQMSSQEMLNPLTALIDSADLGADVSHDSNSSTNSFSSNLDSVSSNIDAQVIHRV